MDIDPNQAYEEWQAGEKARQARQSAVRTIIEGYTGPFFNSRGVEVPEQTVNYNPENHNYSYLSFMVPSMAYSRPRVGITSRIWGGDADAEVKRYGVDAWMNETKYERHTQKIATDLLISGAVSLCTLIDHPFLKVEGRKAKFPSLQRISPRLFNRDPSGYDSETCQWTGHRWKESKRKLLKRIEGQEGWRTDMIRSLPEGAEDRDSRGYKIDIPHRDEVWICEMHFPGHGPIEPGNTPEKGYHGVIYTMAFGANEDGNNAGEFIRDPMDYFGPERGPYTFTEVYYVPDDPYGLSPCIATEGQVRDVNLHARAMSKSMALYKKFVMCADANVAQALVDTPHDTVIALPGVERGSVVPAEVGGISNQWLEYYALASDRLRGVAGITDAQRAQVSQGSATAASYAESASDVRTDFLKQRMHNHVEEELAKVAEYMHIEEDVVIPVSPQVMEALGLPMQPGEVPVLRGGSKNLQGVDVPFSMYSLDIEPMSMERSSEGVQQRRTLDFLTAVGQLVPIMSQFPWPGWAKVMDLMGEAFNIPGLADLGTPAPQALQASPGKGGAAMKPGAAKTSGRNDSGLVGHHTGAELTAAAKA